jgi:hypothetical protein
MDIFLFQAFASNNSGSYTIVGSFRDSAVATKVADILSKVTEEHNVWHEKHDGGEEGESPLDVFVKQFGLHDSKPGRDDDWPNYNGSPTVVAIDNQVLVHVAYTVSMPRVYGEFFYVNGGRVQVELDHAHDDIAVEFTFWVQYNDPAKAEKLDAFEARLAEELGALISRAEHDQRPPIEPAWYQGHWGIRHLAVIFRDLVDGVTLVGRLAREMGVDSRFDIRECPGNVPDPFAILRSSTIPIGLARVILWQIGDRIAAMKAVREALGCGLDDAKKLLADLPSEIIDKVDIGYAKKAVAILKAAGCDAEVVIPSKRD